MKYDNEPLRGKSLWKKMLPGKKVALGKKSPEKGPLEKKFRIKSPRKKGPQKKDPLEKISIKKSSRKNVPR